MDSMTPPRASRSRSSSLDSEFDEAYFFKTYVPLSNLPTPPLSSHSTSHVESAEARLAVGENLDPDLLGPATHLTNLIPSSTSLTTSSVPLVHSILTRAELPLETIALAVCILDSLNSRFALAWRQGLPLSAPYPPLPFGQFDDEREEKQHIDSVHPELIVLAALALAVKFLDDRQQSTRRHASFWGKDLWTWDQVNFTQRVVLENLGYRILPLWEECIIGEALEDMKRAGGQVSPVCDDWDEETCYSGSFGSERNGSEHRRNVSTEKAVRGNNRMITPVEAPMVENSRGTRDVSFETKVAFRQAEGSKQVRLTDRGSNEVTESFPVYEDPMVMVMGMEYRMR